MKNKKFDCNYIQAFGFLVAIMIIVCLSIIIGYKIGDNKIKVSANDNSSRFEITETYYNGNSYFYIIQDSEYQNEYIVVESLRNNSGGVGICPVTK